ncbi:thioredoxin family protein [Cohnella terricola]|uniref:Thioredoxin family protein n=1 Tax=Cohnella terricola TaxID=1289167 RepID=A0A559JEN8_9BACL|nr:thioredoxin family protein [Cohnella terricola]TVX98333.1 thioredoxin family protein [Cohnella terricola]
MEKQINLKHKIGKGISPRQFIEGMRVRTMELSLIPNTKERMIANYEHFTWPNEEDRKFFSGLGEHFNLVCLILCTDWCPDVIWNVPVLFRTMEEAGIPTEVLIMEDHMETMDLFLTDGGRAQPIAIWVESSSGIVLGRWGARPAYIQEVMDRFKRENPDKEASDYQEKLNGTYREIGGLYHNGLQYQKVMIQELKELLASFGQVD